MTETCTGYDKSEVRRQVLDFGHVLNCAIYKALTWANIKMGLPVTASLCGIQKMHKTFSALQYPPS